MDKKLPEPEQLIYEFHAELLDFTPKIWRDFQTRGDITLHDLARILMALYKMDGSHCYMLSFAPKGGRKSDRLYFQPNEQRVENIFNSNDDEVDEDLEPFGHTLEIDDPGDIDECMLYKISIQKGDKFILNYDFGDDWHVSARIKKVFVDDKLNSVDFPRVLKGEGYGIIEDVGGVWGMEEIFELTDDGERSESYRNFFDNDDVDLSKFDLEEMNRSIKGIC